MMPLYTTWQCSFYKNQINPSDQYFVPLCFLAIYEDNPTNFVDKYISLLSSGGAKHHKDLLTPFGLDTSNPDFWDSGLSLISSMIDELEKIS